MTFEPSPRLRTMAAPTPAFDTASEKLTLAGVPAVVMLGLIEKLTLVTPAVALFTENVVLDVPATMLALAGVTVAPFVAAGVTVYVCKAVPFSLTSPVMAVPATPEDAIDSVATPAVGDGDAFRATDPLTLTRASPAAINAVTPVAG